MKVYALSKRSRGFPGKVPFAPGIAIPQAGSSGHTLPSPVHLCLELSARLSAEGCTFNPASEHAGRTFPPPQLLDSIFGDGVRLKHKKKGWNLNRRKPTSGGGSKSVRFSQPGFPLPGRVCLRTWIRKRKIFIKNRLFYQKMVGF